MLQCSHGGRTDVDRYLSVASTDYLATKADIEELRGEMKSVKWMMDPLIVINFGLLGKLLFT